MKRKIISICVLLSISTITMAQEDKLIDPRDGQVYKTIKIGNQIWMAQNLNYESKDSIFYKENRAIFPIAKFPYMNYVPDSHCYNDSVANCDKYGRLYIWKAAEKACPVGWHLPSKADYETLLTKIGVEEKRKISNSILPGGNSGFNLLFGGRGLEMSILIIKQDFISKYKKVGFWTNTYSKINNTEIKATETEFLISKKMIITNYYCEVSVDHLFSVRCIKD